MIPLPFVYLPQAKNKEHGDKEPCLICKMPIRNPRYFVHLGDGGSHLVTQEEADKDPSGDMGWFPVGPDCWKNHPEIHPYGEVHLFDKKNE